MLDSKQKHEENMKEKDQKFELEKMRLQKEINETNNQMQMFQMMMMNNHNMMNSP